MLLNRILNQKDTYEMDSFVAVDEYIGCAKRDLITRMHHTDEYLPSLNRWHFLFYSFAFICGIKSIQYAMRWAPYVYRMVLKANGRHVRNARRTNERWILHSFINILVLNVDFLRLKFSRELKNFIDAGIFTIFKIWKINGKWLCFFFMCWEFDRKSLVFRSKFYAKQDYFICWCDMPRSCGRSEINFDGYLNSTGNCCGSGLLVTKLCFVYRCDAFVSISSEFSSEHIRRIEVKTNFRFDNSRICD